MDRSGSSRHFPGDSDPTGNAVNNAGDVVGESGAPGGWRAVIWKAAEHFKPADLNEAVPRGTPHLGIASGINDAGAIVGYETYEGNTKPGPPWMLSAPLIVNQTTDATEPGTMAAKGVCDVNSRAMGDQCSLNAAIQVENDDPNAPKTIAFAIPGGTTPDIVEKKQMVLHADGVTIDGSTQSGGRVDVSDGGNSSGGGASTVSRARKSTPVSQIPPI